MSLSKSKAILRLYEEVLRNGSDVPENTNLHDIIQICEKKGQYIFHTDSYWNFIKSQHKNLPCIRMIFAIKEEDGGKIQNIDKIVELIREIETTLIFVDKIDIVKSDKFIYIDSIKIIRNK